MDNQWEIPKISLPQSSDWVLNVKRNAELSMKRYDSCTQSILASFMEEIGIMDPMIISSAGAMHGGMVSSLTCGIHIAGLMVLGLFMGRYKLEQGMDGLFPIVIPAQTLIKRLNNRLGSHSCKELTGLDFTDIKQAIKFVSSHEYEKCILRVGDGAEVIGHFLEELDKNGELFRVK